MSQPTVQQPATPVRQPVPTHPAPAFPPTATRPTARATSATSATTGGLLSGPLADPTTQGRVAGGAYCAAGFLAAVLALLPWAEKGRESLTGVQDIGVTTLLLGLFVAGFGVTRMVGRTSGTAPLAWATVVLASAGFHVMVALSLMGYYGDQRADVRFGLVLSLLLGLALALLALADAALALPEALAAEPGATETRTSLVLGAASALGVAVLGPAAVVLGGLQLRRHAESPLPQQQRAHALTAVVTGGIGTFWLAVGTLVLLFAI